MKKLYSKYRKWARTFTQKQIIIIGASSGLVGATLCFLFPDFFTTKTIAILLPVVGIIAAFDAWGAAIERGRRKEAYVRASLILFICIATSIFFYKNN